jgi:hypothetical protein
LFELMSIAQVAAVALFLSAFAQLPAPRRFEWLFAITAMGGLGVVSLLAGNVGIVLNLTVLALALYAAMGNSLSLRLLPVMIAAGTLIKPQFALYFGLLLSLERSRLVAIVKAIAGGVAALAIHGIYIVLRPDDWKEYTQAVVKRTIELRDFGWGPPALSHYISDASAAPFAVYVVTLLIVCALAYATWRKSIERGPIPAAAMVSLVFIVLTFANPRIPLYDLYAAAIALSVCCAYTEGSSRIAWVLIPALSINLLPWLIANFTRVPSAYPWWLQQLLIMHLLGMFSLFITLSRIGMQRAVEVDGTPV